MFSHLLRRSGSNKTRGRWANRVVHLFDDMKRVLMTATVLVLSGLAMVKVIEGDLSKIEPQTPSTLGEAAIHSDGTAGATTHPPAASGSASTQSGHWTLILCSPFSGQADQICFEVHQILIDGEWSPFDESESVPELSRKAGAPNGNGSAPRNGSSGRAGRRARAPTKRSNATPENEKEHTCN